jgi:fibronectin type 3 domain-containing protein
MPVTIPSGQSTTFAVTFKPQASGATSASLSFSSNASNSPAVQSMTGTGAAAVQHTVDLSWTASPDVVGYNIYRGTAAGGPYAMINTSLDGSTTYTDGTVVSGTTYYYVATAVNSESQDSGYSNQAQAIVPNP